MRRFIFTIILPLIYTITYSQNSQPNLQIVTTAGDYYVGQGITLSWTLGEPVIETFVSTDKTVTLTQGFQQPNSTTGYTISGKVVYDNSVQSGMAATWVYLTNNDTKKKDSIQTDSTTNTGYYTFKNLPNGNYSITCNTRQPWRHANPGDALIVNRNYIGSYSLTPFVKKAGDVTNDGKDNPGDALMINRRYINLIHKYNIKDWLFQQTNITINGANINQNIQAICAADMKGQYVPPLKKLSDEVSLSNNGIVLVANNSEFELPVQVTRDLTLGAVGLVITYPTDNIEIESVSSNMNGLLYNINNGEVRIAWTDQNNEGVGLKSNDAIVNLKVKAKNLQSNTEKMLNLNTECVLVDNYTNTLYGEQLNIPRIAMKESNSSGYYLSQNYPNPFNTFTMIDYSLAEQASVSINVYDMLGKKVAELVNEYESAGTHQIKYSVEGLARGIYLYRLEAVGTNSNYINVKRLIVE